MQNCTAVDEALRERLGLEQPAFVAQLLPQLMELVRASRRLPVGEEHAIRRGSKEFLSASKDLGQRSMSAVFRLMRFLDPDLQASSTRDELVSFSLIEDSVDTVLERVDSCLRDALAGISRAADANADPDALGNGSSAESSSAAAIPKPQVRWRELIDNDRAEFVPRLLTKHNQKVALSEGFLEAQRRVGLRAAAGLPSSHADSSRGTEAPSGMDAENNALHSHLSALGVERSGESNLTLGHPYEEELRLLTYPDGLFETIKPQHFGRMEDTPLVWVRTARELRALINEVKATCVGKEIAVDVEHHDLRSYRGFVCLVQLSTRQKDFLIDPFDIFEEMHWLNEIFTDPAILKVLHGADRDVQWLQRDFSVYLVHMFDTGLATRALKLQGGFSLANLVSHFCGVKLDKKYQTADWRQRPMSPEMAQYARCDTHYLLYCFDCLRNALLAGGPYKVGEVPEATSEGVQALRGVLDRSAALCKTQYTEAPFDAANTAMRLCERFGSKQRPLESRQFSSLKALTAWRDTLARRLDESWNYIAPDACLWRVALDLPSTPARLRSTCNPLPPTVQQYASEVVDIVVKSAEAAATADVPHSPMLMPQRRPSAPAVQEAVAQEPTVAVAVPNGVTTPQRPAATSEKPHSSAQQHPVWPPSSCREAPPIVRVSSGSLRHAADVDAIQRLQSSSSLASFFESESSEDEEIDVAVLKDLTPAFSGVDCSPAVEDSPVQGLEVVLTDTADVEIDAAQQTAEEDVKAEPQKVGEAAAEAEPQKVGEAAAEAEAQSLRDTYQLPRANRRKKKKKKDAEVLSAAAALPPSTSGTSLEAEAATFRTALSGALFAATVPCQQPHAQPRPTKRKNTATLGAAVEASVAVASDPYAVATDDPYAAAAGASDLYAEASSEASVHAVPTAVATDGRPRKKKKVRPEQPQPQPNPVMDPYL